MQQNNNKTVLIVDDEKLIAQALTEKLASVGFTVETASDGEEALLKASQLKPDLILLDIIMPKLDGISALKKLKAQDATKNIPVIILSNLYDDEKVTEVINSGGTDYLVKVEHTLSDIVAKVKEKLNL